MAVNKQRILKLIFITGLFLSPFIFWPKAEIPFEIPKVFFINRWIEAMVLVGILTLFTRLKKEYLDSVLIFLIASFFGVSFLSSIVGTDLSKSIIGNPYRADGLITLSHLITFSFLVCLFFQKSWLKSTSIAVALSSIGVSLWTLYEGFQLYILGNQTILHWDGAIAVSFGNPNFLAGYLMVTLPFTYSIISYSNRIFNKYMGVFFMITQILAIFLTFSWAGVFGVLTFFLIALTSKPIKYKLVFSLLFGLILLSLVYIFVSSQKKDPQILVAEGRGRIFRKGLFAFSQKPILGWGWANFDHAFDSVDWPIKLENDVYVDKAHSHFLEVLVTTGISGLILYLIIILRTLMNLVKKYKFSSPYVFAFILFIIHSQTNVISISEEVIFWFLIGLAVKE